LSEGGVKPKVVAELMRDYLFKITFPDANTTLIMDEPAPLGKLSGPNASRVLAAAVANCLSASLAFCLRKSKIEVKGVRAEAEPSIERNKEGYWRVTKINVRIKPETADSADQHKVRKCLEIFENYCVVTGAVREGIQVDVQVDTRLTGKPSVNL